MPNSHLSRLMFLGFLEGLGHGELSCTGTNYLLPGHKAASRATARSCGPLSVAKSIARPSLESYAGLEIVP